jgi:hypothetical protein
MKFGRLLERREIHIGCELFGGRGHSIPHDS